MDFQEKVFALAKKVQQQSHTILTEEATKTALILPFIHNVLGYDIFDPSEVIPEFIADVGTKKGEKIDYAIVNNGNVQILIEAKKIGEELNPSHVSQLYRYFSVTPAKIAILTNGQRYKFYTDLDSPNKMDDRPFLDIDIIDIDDHALPELRKIAKSNFDIESIINAAGELKYLNQIKKIFATQMETPDDGFVRFFASRIYEGQVTQKVREQFGMLVQKAFAQFLNDRINSRLKSAITGVGTSAVNTEPAVDTKASASEEIADDGIVTTIEEIEGFNIVKAIVRSSVSPNRIIGRDTKSYFGVLLDDNNRKPICRLHFNRSQKYIGIFDNDKNETRHPIDTLDDIFNFSEQLKQTASFYDLPAG